MNTYAVYDTNTFDGESIGTVTANSADEALENAIFLYGPNVNVVRQYTTTGLSIDPLWILLGLLLIARLTSHRRAKL